ncbi:MAG: ABC transporter substrate-binding protein [Chloroflexi bacterium]|nr:ABC transporter substrate-binding protein [Chloroflexota bacterium]
MKKVFVLFSSLVLLSLLLAACGPTPTPPPPVTVVVTEIVTQPPTAVPTAAPPTPTPVASVDPSALAQKGKLLICSDLPYPPQEFFDANGNPTGSDIEIGLEIANRLGLQGVVVNSVFDTIIAAVTSGKCDIIISAQNITTDRQKQVSMIPYFQAGQSMVVAKGNPDNINAPTDLCGKSAAAESGTTEADYLQGTGDYKGKGLPAECSAAGKPPVNVVVTQKDTDALQQLQAGKVAAYFADSPVASYYTVQHPDQFQVVGQIIEPAMEGISVPCGQADCTNAPLTPLGQAVKTALQSMMADGTYLKILTKYGLQSGAVTLQ